MFSDVDQPMMVIRKKLTGDEVSSPGFRYDETCDCIQTTPDGGTTWIDTPGVDPRTGDIYRFPPLTGEDARCNAAARQRALWEETYNTFIASTSAAQFATIILNIVLTLVGTGLGAIAGVLLALIFLVLDALIFIGKEAMEAAFDGDVWDRVEEIIYCNIGDDGQISAEQLDSIYAAINEDYPGTVYNTLIEIGHLYGEVLLSNAAVERDEIGDCDGFACDWCLTVDLRDNDGGFVAYNNGNSYATYVSGEGWRSNFFAPPANSSVQALIVCLDLPAATSLHQIIWIVEGLGGTNRTNVLYADCVLSDLRADDGEWNGEEDWITMSVYAQWYPDVGNTQPVYLRAFTLRGTGTPPELPGWVECDP